MPACGLRRQFSQISKFYVHPRFNVNVRILLVITNKTSCPLEMGWNAKRRPPYCKHAQTLTNLASAIIAKRPNISAWEETSSVAHTYET